MAQKKRTQSHATRPRPKARMTTKQKQRRRKIMRRYYVTILIVTLIACFVYILNLSQFRINTISVTTGPIINAGQIEKKVERYLQDYTWKIFPKDSIFWYSKQKLSDHLYSNYPEIKSLDINLRKFDILEIKIIERLVDYQLYADGTLYDLDTQSVIFQESTTKEPQRIFYSNTATFSDVFLGKNLMDSQLYIQTNNFLDSLQQKGINVSEIYFENKIQTVLVLDNGVRIVIHPSDDPAAIIATLNDVVTYKEFGFNRQTGTFAQPLAYINLRHGNKLFYCYSGDACDNNYIIPRYD